MRSRALTPHDLRLKMERETTSRRAILAHDPYLTVRKAVIEKSVCRNCAHSWPYIEGDELKRCPACQGGEPQSWSKSVDKSERLV